MALVRCRHCLALVVPDDAACSVCHGRDPSGRRFALLGSLFLGSLAGAGLTGVFAAGLSWKWHRWLALFGDPDNPAVAVNAATMAPIVGAFVFLLGSFTAATVIHKTASFR